MINNDELALKLAKLAKNAGADEWQAKKISGDQYVIRKGSYRVESGFCTYQEIAEIDDNSTRLFVAYASPANILALLAERDADKKRIDELEARTVSVKLPDEFYTIADNIRTQDNRITSEPMFCVYQKREIAVDPDCDYDRIVWVDEDGNEASEHKSARLELLHENFREPPDGWRRVALKDVDDFVTCCFTERGCKDYLACNGHNLRLPFIYVKSGFRNAEYIAIRNWLAGIKLEVGLKS